MVRKLCAWCRSRDPERLLVEDDGCGSVSLKFKLDGGVGQQRKRRDCEPRDWKLVSVKLAALGFVLPTLSFVF